MSRSTQFAKNNIDFKKVMSDKIERAMSTEKMIKNSSEKTVYTFKAA